MEIAGRITNNAIVHELNDGRQVVHFTIAVNDRFKRKDEDQFTEVATFFNCSYWRNPGIAQHLMKSKLVQVYGRVSINVYNNSDGKARGSLQFHVNEIKFLGGTKREHQNQVIETVPQTVTEEHDDLPF